MYFYAWYSQTCLHIYVSFSTDLCLRNIFPFAVSLLFHETECCFECVSPESTRHISSPKVVASMLTIRQCPFKRIGTSWTVSNTSHHCELMMTGQIHYWDVYFLHWRIDSILCGGDKICLITQGLISIESEYIMKLVSNPWAMKLNDTFRQLRRLR